MKKILYFIQLPPPIHGVSTINQYVYESEKINEEVEKALLEIKFSDDIRGLRKFTLNKVFRFFISLLQLFFKLLIFKPDFIYFSIMPVGKGLIRDVLYVFIIKLLGVKPIYHLHNKGIEANMRNSFLKYIYKWIFEDAVIIHLSEKLMEREIGGLGLKNAVCFIVPNGIKEEPFIKIERQDGIINLLFLSNLFWQKGVFVLLKAFAQVAEKYDHVKLNIVGASRGKKQEESISVFIKKNGLAGKTEYYGPLYSEEKKKHFTNADIFVLPSLNESFGLVNIEAMHYELPVIATDQGAIPEIIIDGETGFVVKTGSVDDLVEKIGMLVENRELRLKMGESGQKRFKENYTYSIFESNMKAVFDSLM